MSQRAPGGGGGDRRGGSWATVSPPPCPAALCLHPHGPSRPESIFCSFLLEASYSLVPRISGRAWPEPTNVTAFESLKFFQGFGYFPGVYTLLLSPVHDSTVFPPHMFTLTVHFLSKFQLDSPVLATLVTLYVRSRDRLTVAAGALVPASFVSPSPGPWQPLLCFCEFDFLGSRFHIQLVTGSVCLSLSVLFHVARCPLDSSICCKSQLRFSYIMSVLLSSAQMKLILN